MKTNVVLIGFMGVGKSAVGKILAERLGKKYIEADSLIVQKTGKSIPRIFQEHGEIYFRELEIETIKEIASKKGQVIDCGGGVVLNKINIDRLKRDGVIVWLTASPATILKRTTADGMGRPLLKGKCGIEDINSLIRFRKSFYEHAADIKINTSRLGITTVATRIVEQLEENEDFN
jgi:shikimate kinase